MDLGVPHLDDHLHQQNLRLQWVFRSAPALRHAPAWPSRTSRTRGQGAFSTHVRHDASSPTTLGGGRRFEPRYILKPVGEVGGQDYLLKST